MASNFGSKKTQDIRKKGRVDPAKQITERKPKTDLPSSTPNASFRASAAGNPATGSLNDVIGLRGAGSGIAGTGTGSGGFNTGTGGTTTDFGNQFLPGMFGELWSNPDVLIRTLMQNQGIGTRGGTYAALLDQADNLGILWMLAQGQDVAQGTPNFIDWSGQYLQNQITPGGASIGAADVANALQGAYKDENSPLRNYLANPGLTPSDQVGNVLSTLNRSLEGANMPDIVRAAFLARAREVGDTFQMNRATAPSSQPFLDSLIRTGYLDALGGGR